MPLAQPRHDVFQGPEGRVFVGGNDVVALQGGDNDATALRQRDLAGCGRDGGRQDRDRFPGNSPRRSEASCSCSHQTASAQRACSAPRACMSARVCSRPAISSARVMGASALASRKANDDRNSTLAACGWVLSIQLRAGDRSPQELSTTWE